MLEIVLRIDSPRVCQEMSEEPWIAMPFICAFHAVRPAENQSVVDVYVSIAARTSQDFFSERLSRSNCTEVR